MLKKNARLSNGRNYAYVQGDLLEEIYMNQPEPFVVKEHENKVCLLKRPLYG